MNLVYCIDDLWQGGGTERVLTTKVNWLVEHGHHVTVITLDEDTRAPFFELDSRVERLALPRSGYTTALNEALCRLRPDVTVVTQGLATDAAWQCKDGSLKVLEFHYTRNFLVNFVRGIDKIRFKQLHLLKMRWLQWRLQRTARKYDLFVGLTRRDVGLWGNPSNMTFVYNPLSFRSERKSDCKAHRIIGVGSWTPAKGFDQLLEAFGPLASKYPDWSVVLYGQGQDEERLNRIIHRYHMENQVTLYGLTPNIGERLLEASIYAFPSRSDGFGLVITEAMECGLPTVAMDCECGPREIVTSDTGVVVPDKDIVAFRQALQRLMDNESLRCTMGQAAQTQVTRFYADAIMPQWIELFNNHRKN